MATKPNSEKASASSTPKKTRRSVASDNVIQRVLNIIPSRNQDRDWTFSHASDAAVFRLVHRPPTSVDLRERWWGINDQGNTGSCVGWATADGVLRWLLVKAGRLPQDKLMSPRFIWMAAKETDEFTSQPTTFIEDDGTSLKAALDIARKYGSVLDDILPFQSGHLYSNSAQTFYAIAAQRKISSYFNLGVNASHWRTWLASKGPILTRLGVDATWDNATATKGVLGKYQKNTIRGGHAVAIVGYTPSSFIVRNSWGTGWGDKGFAYASLDYAKAAFTEAYGAVL